MSKFQKTLGTGLDRTKANNEQRLLTIAEVRDELRNINSTMKAGFTKLGVHFGEQPTPPATPSPVDKPEKVLVQNKPTFARVARKAIHDRISFPPRQRNRSRSRSVVVIRNRGKITPVTTPQKDRRRPVNPCIFCNSTDCENSSECGLMIPWSMRVEMLRELGACPNMTCLKIHEGVCSKYEKDQVRCTYCGRKHHVVFCRALGEDQECLKPAEKAKRERALAKSMAQGVDKPSSSKS